MKTSYKRACTSGVTEVQAKDLNLESEICPEPVTPGGSPLACPPQIEDDGAISISFAEDTENGRIEGDLFIDTQFTENATNRLLVCLCFFRWTGKEYIPVPLIDGRESLKYLAIGNIEEAHLDYWHETETEE